MSQTANRDSDRYYEAHFTEMHSYGVDACPGNIVRIKVTQQLVGQSARIYMCEKCHRVYGVTDKGLNVAKSAD